ncbi:MAG TPA: hypothetical protein VGG44_04670 [Tepidisphaeraceae bacterium]
MQNSNAIQRSETVVVGAALTTLDVLNLLGLTDYVAVSVTNNSGQALIDFQVQLQMHPDDPFLAEFVAADFSASPPPVGDELRRLRGNPSTLAAGQTATFTLKAYKSTHAVQFQAQTTSGTANVTIRTTRVQDG